MIAIGLAAVAIVCGGIALGWGVSAGSLPVIVAASFLSLYGLVWAGMIAGFRREFGQWPVMRGWAGHRRDH